jgi:hypothetical protein
MAFSHDIDPARRLVTIRADRLPSLRDLEDVLHRVQSDPRFQPGFGVLSDRRHFDAESDAPYVRAAIDALARRHDTFHPTRFAIVTSHLATYGMGRMAEVYAENRNVLFRVFMDELSALAWLLELPI